MVQVAEPAGGEYVNPPVAAAQPAPELAAEPAINDFAARQQRLINALVPLAALPGRGKVDGARRSYAAGAQDVVAARQAAGGGRTAAAELAGLRQDRVEGLNLRLDQRARFMLGAMVVWWAAGVSLIAGDLIATGQDWPRPHHPIVDVALAATGVVLASFGDNARKSRRRLRNRDELLRLTKGPVPAQSFDAMGLLSNQLDEERRAVDKLLHPPKPASDQDK